MSKVLLAGTGVFLLYCGWRVWRHTTAEKPQLMRTVPDRFEGWEKEVERIFGRSD
jgi:hypothetical protein